MCLASVVLLCFKSQDVFKRGSLCRLCSLNILYDKRDICTMYVVPHGALLPVFSSSLPKSATLVLFSHLMSKVLAVRRKLTAWSLLNISNTQPVISCRLFFCCLQRNINTALISGRFLLSEFLLLYLSYNLPGGEVIKF